ncbi:MAG: phosphate starvation-inducible protein PhoH [Flavobacteriales bacterium]|nr:MAG: phosphate starvation-inducible protein PhoH [Flavobacteriales bacterium]
MRELIFQIDVLNPVEIFGVNNSKINLIKKHFPKLKIIARGDTVKAVGEENELTVFEQKFKLFIEHFNQFNLLTESNIDELMERNGGTTINEVNGNGDILVHGTNGVLVKARTVNQRKLVKSSEQNDMVFAIGPAGTGKTYTAVALAVRAIKNREVKRIILTRPAVEAGENLGFLPGDLKEKLDPYIQPLYDALRDMIPFDKLNTFLEKGIIQIAPLAFMRGRTLDNAYVILDEAQNATQNQLKMFLTRMGKNAKFIITGDITQVDLPKNQPSGLLQAEKLFKKIKGIDFIFLDEKDVVRHKLVKQIIKAYNPTQK